MVFNGDNTYETTITSSLTIHLTVPVSCLMGGACSDLETSLNEEADVWSCAESGDKCECDNAQMETSVEPGSWATDGDMITLTPDDTESEPSTGVFCVNGGSMSFFEDGADGPLQIEFSKQ